MKVLYLKNAEWEFDFFQYDIFHRITDKIEIQPFESSELSSLETDETLVENCILIINHAAYYWDVEQFVKKIKPVIIFHLSDEDANLPYWEYLSQYTKIYFRQYHHVAYQHSFTNIYQIPLGYVSNFLSKQYSLEIIPQKMAVRKYSASFIGEFKSDREYMCKTFLSTFENTYIHNVSNRWKLDQLQFSPKDMFEIYNNSIFVPVGRGNQSLDCFRIYEGVVSGAIPVIVGSNSEIQNTFQYNGNKPPFLFFENWDIAVEKCKELSKNVSELQRIQDEIHTWWMSEIHKIQDKIDETLSIL
jgi:hypothetical protein